MQLTDLIMGAEEQAEDYCEFSLNVRLPSGQVVPVTGALYDPDDAGAITLEVAEPGIVEAAWRGGQQ